MSMSHIRRRNRFDRLNENAADEANRLVLNPKEEQGDGEVEHITLIMWKGRLQAVNVKCFSASAEPTSSGPPPRSEPVWEEQHLGKQRQGLKNRRENSL